MSWVVINIGCIECGVDSNMVGVFATEKEAERVIEICHEKFSWRGGGQNGFEAWELTKPGVITDEYKEVIEPLLKEKK